MKDVIEAALTLAGDLIGLNLDPKWTPYLLLLTAGAGVLFWTYRKLRVAFGGISAVSDELKAVSDETTRNLEVVQKGLAGVLGDLERTIASRFDTLESIFHSQTAITSQPEDPDLAGEPKEEMSGRVSRLKIAEAVRDATMKQWLTGMSFAIADIGDRYDPNIFEFIGTAESGTRFRLLLRTPYRAAYGSDGRLAYALEVWVNGYKHLNFEWDSDGNYALRGFKRGDWNEDIVNWQFPSSAGGAVRAA